MEKAEIMKDGHDSSGYNFGIIQCFLLHLSTVKECAVKLVQSADCDKYCKVRMD
jgi:hypothetical protein